MTTVLHVEGMMCGHCVSAVTKAAGALPGVTETAVDLAAKTVTVTHAPALPPARIQAAIEEQGYEVV